jgi:hypothetical protein
MPCICLKQHERQQWVAGENLFVQCSPSTCYCLVLK